MITCFDNTGVKIAELNPTGLMAAVRKPLCESCDWLRKADLECWHPSQKCATRRRPWQFAACPGDLWAVRASGLQSPGNPTATLVLRIPGEDWTGFGQSANLIALALLARGIEFEVLVTRYDESKCPLPSEIKQRIVDLPSPGLPVLSIGSIPVPGTLGSNNEALFTLWESTAAPPSFARLAAGCRLVLTATEWGRAIFARATSTPIVAVPLCIDAAAWPERPMPPGPFTFLAAGRLAHGGARKGLQTVISAFQTEFPIEDVRLRVKGWADCPMDIPDDPRIDVVDRYLLPAEMAEWYASGHVFVSAARAEGWGLHQIQAMATGRPLIAAAYSAMAEYLDKSVGYPVKFSEVPASGGGGYSGRWAEIDMASLRAKMREAYHRRPALLRRGAAAARKAREFTPGRTAVGIIRAMHSAGALRQRTFYHSGDIGDVIYALPTIRALGGGILYLGPVVNQPHGVHPRIGITAEICKNLRGLLEAQSYIHQVVFAPSPPTVDHDLNKFRLYWKGFFKSDLEALWARKRWFKTYPLAWIHAAAFGVDFDESQPWLSVQKNGCHKTIIIARSERARGKAFPWRAIVKRIGPDSAFVGTPKEHRDFCNRFGRVEFLPTPTLLDLAVVLAGAELFIGNTSAPLAMAQGMGKQRIVECRDDAHPFDSDLDPARQTNFHSGNDPETVLNLLTP